MTRVFEFIEYIILYFNLQQIIVNIIYIYIYTIEFNV